MNIICRLTVAMICASTSLVSIASDQKNLKAKTNVSVVEAQMKVVPDVVNAFGHMAAIHQVNLSFEVGGHINKIYQHSGRVKKGELIMTLNDDVDRAQLKALQATLSLDQSNYERSKKLKAFGGVSQASLEAAKATVKKDEANVEQQLALINKKKLTTPFDGVLGDLKFSTGAYLNAGQAVISLVQEAPLKVRYSLPASLKNLLEIGQNIKVYANQKSFVGVVNFISPQVNAASGTLTLEAQVENKNYALTPGEFVSVIQVLNPNRKLLVVPSVSVMSDILGQYVFVIKKHIADKQYVKTGEITKDDVQILSGLKVGEKVVVAGQQKIYQNTPVNIVPLSLHLTSSVSRQIELSSTAEKT